jgi:sigma-B regulation protein RsbU (phosphoserine phosphatase)
MIPRAALLTLPAERQERLLSLLGKEGEESLFLREALLLGREALGADCLAVYVASAEGVLECAAHVGASELPAVLEPGEALPWPSHPLPGGLLVCGEPLPAELPDPLVILLATGVRLVRLRQELKRHAFDARYRGVEREALYDVGLAIASTLDLHQVSEEILLRAVSLLDARRGALFLLDAEAERYRRQATIGGSAAEALPLAVEPETDGFAAAAPLPGASHLLGVPVEVEGERRGLLVVGDKESRSGVGPFPDEDRRALALFANQAALALEQARLHQEALEKERLEREMELAAGIQRGILPRALPVVAGYELAGWTRPARHVGGDYFDAVPLPEGRWALLVADVSGKGVSAALLVSTLHSALRLLLARGAGKEEMLGAVNGHLVEFSASNKFVTLLLAELDPAEHRVSYVNAGHNPGLLLRAAGGTETLAASAVPLGLLPAALFREVSTDLAPGDLLCLYSDGVTEAASRQGEELGMARLERVLRAHHAAPLGEIEAAIEAELREFTRGTPQGDDQTVLLLRRTAGG